VGAAMTPDRIRALAQELVGLQPDIILATSTVAAVALQREKRMIPIGFASVSDPVASASSHGSTARARGRIDSPSASSLGRLAR
jgi:putative tryptophan/tyrosine transport system substrate-binding protein